MPCSDIAVNHKASGINPVSSKACMGGLLWRCTNLHAASSASAGALHELTGSLLQGAALLQEFREFLPGNGNVRVMEDDEFKILSNF